MNVNEDGRIDLSAIKYIPRRVAEDMQRWLTPGDVLFNNTNSPELVGKTALYEEGDPRPFSNHMTRLRTDPRVLDPAYCAHVLHHYWRTGYFAAHCNNHVSQASVDRRELLSTAIPLPPPLEQRRIVEHLEQLLIRLRSCRDRLNRIPAILSQFRQSVLEAACSGRLTISWRILHPDLAAPELLRPLRPSSQPQEGEDALPVTWAIASFGNLADNFDGKRVPVKSHDRQKRQGPYPYYGASGIIDHVDAYLFDGAYILIAEDGANLLSRSTPIAFPASGRFWVNNHAHVVQPRRGILLSYLGIFFNGYDLQHHVTGSAQPKLTQAALNAIPVPVPPTEEQEEIVRRVEAVFTLAATVERQVVRAKQLAGNARDACLSRAFRGELVPTEAELAAAEGRSYEPAEDLLRRVSLGAASDIAPSSRSSKRTRRAAMS